MATISIAGFQGSGSNGSWTYYGSGYARGRNPYVDSTSYKYKTRGKFTVTPAANKKITAITLSTRVVRSGATNLYCYLLDSEPTTVTTAPSSYLGRARYPSSGTSNPTSSGAIWTFSWSGLNITANKTLYVWFCTVDDISGALTQIWDGSSEASISVTESYYKTTWTASSNNTNYGTVSGSGTYTSGTIVLTATPKAGFKFDGWTFTRLPSTSAGGSKVNPWSNTASTYFGYDYTAVGTFSAATYTMTLNKNGGSGGTNSVDIVYGTGVGHYPSITLPSRTGYSFTGYYSSTSGGTQWYNSAGNSVRTFNLTANGTWYAQWSNNSYTISYALNSGTLPSGTDKTHSMSGKVEALNPTSARWDLNPNISGVTYTPWFYIEFPTRTGYTFNGWTVTGMDSNIHHGWYSSANQSSNATSWANTSAFGNSTHEYYNLRATAGTVTFSANWTNNSYSISYTLNGGSQATANNTVKTYTIGSDSNVKRVVNPTSSRWDTWPNVSGANNIWMVIEKPTRTGYTFNGWNITGMDTNAHKGWSDVQGKTLTSNNASESNISAFGKECTVYYNLRASSGTVNFAAAWTEKTATLSFNMLGGSGGPSAITMKYTTATTIPAASTWPTSTGYACIGWATSEARAKNGNVDYTAGATYKAANVVPTAATLYAVWRSTVSYNANNGTGAPAAAYMYYTPAFTISTTQPTRTGYTFDHWNTAADDSGTSFSSGAQLKAANAWKANTTLYAQWNRNLFNVTINLDGGTQPNGRDVLTQNGEQTIVHNPTVASYDMKNFTPLSGTSYINTFMAIDRPTKTGYTFHHWVITGMENITHNTWIGSGSVSFTGTTYDTSAFSDPTAPNYQYLRATAGTVVFTAHYTANQYNLKVSPNGGTFNNSTGTTTFTNGLTYDGTTNNVLNIPARTGYSFNGWWTDPVNGELVYDAIVGEAVQGTYWSTTGSSAVYKYTGNLTVYAHWKPSGVIRWQYKLVDDHGNEIVNGNGNNIVSVQKYAVFRWNGTEWERCSPYGYHNNEWKIGE